MDEELDLLSEMVSHPGWRVLKREMNEQLKIYYDDLATPATSEFDLIKKEGVTQSIRALKQFVSRVEHRVENFDKRRT